MAVKNKTKFHYKLLINNDFIFKAKHKRTPNYLYLLERKKKAMLIIPSGFLSQRN